MALMEGRRTASGQETSSDREQEAKRKSYAQECTLMYPRAIAAVQETMGSALKFTPRLITIGSFKSKDRENIGGMHFASNVIITIDDLEETPVPPYYLLAHKLTHEITHGWLKYNNCDLPREITEGICELSAAISTRKMFNEGTRTTVNEAIADLISFAKVTGMPAELMMVINPVGSQRVAETAQTYLIPAYVIANEMSKWRDVQLEKGNSSPTEFMKHLINNWEKMPQITSLTEAATPSMLSDKLATLNRETRHLFSNITKGLNSPIGATAPGYFGMLLRGKMGIEKPAHPDEKWQVLFREDQENKEVSKLEALRDGTSKIIRRISTSKALTFGMVCAYACGQIDTVLREHMHPFESALVLGSTAIPAAAAIYLAKRLNRAKAFLTVKRDGIDEVLFIVKDKDAQADPKQNPNNPSP